MGGLSPQAQLYKYVTGKCPRPQPALMIFGPLDRQWTTTALAIFFAHGGNLKLISRLLILVGISAAIMLAHTTANTRSHRLFRNLPKAQLQLTTTILEQKSCSLDHFGLRLRLTLRNIGEEPVILHKQTAISRIMVSRDLRAVAAQQYEQEQRYDDPGADIGLASPIYSDFTIIKPGAVFEFEESVSLYLFNAKRSAERFLSEGTHFLQVDLGSWPYIADPATFRKKWRDKGYLWFEGITSGPMRFTIEKDRPIIKCH